MRFFSAFVLKRKNARNVGNHVVNFLLSGFQGHSQSARINARNFVRLALNHFVVANPERNFDVVCCEDIHHSPQFHITPITLGIKYEMVAI